LQAGGRYSVTVTASDNINSRSDTSRIIVNNPPAVSLQLSQSEIRHSVPLALTASGSDADSDKLTYSWSILNQVGETVKNWGSDNAEQTLDTSSLIEGQKYTARVTVSDGLDTASAEKLFVIEIRGPQVFFDFDKDKLAPISLPKGERLNRTKLDEVVARLKQDPSLSLFIRLEGNADRIGTIPYNECIGCRRACRVRSYLTRKGVKNRIVTIVSFGKSKAEGRTKAQRKLDRRVDLIYVLDVNIPIEAKQGKNVECNCQRTPPGSKCTRR
jgi:outer membrane protein OmpA-like peptidoglycan-associated protein